ncbi:MAG: hypothetical protein R6V33_02440 [Pelovirga sp.]
MEQIEQLRKVTRTAREQQDLPDFIAHRIDELLNCLEVCTLSRVELAELIDQIADYDTYGQTGYLGMGVNHVILGATLDRIFAQLQT